MGGLTVHWFDMPVECYLTNDILIGEPHATFTVDRLITPMSLTSLLLVILISDKLRRTSQCSLEALRMEPDADGRGNIGAAVCHSSATSVGSAWPRQGRNPNEVGSLEEIRNVTGHSRTHSNWAHAWVCTKAVKSVDGPLA